MAEDIEAFDYLTFVQKSRAKLQGEFPDQDLSPNDLAVILNRASGVATGMAEVKVHRPRGLSWNAFKVMFILWMVGDLEQHKVAILADTSRATLSAIVKTLVKNDHLNQIPSEIDKRTNVLALTDAGLAIVRDAYIEQNQLLSGWNSRLTRTEQDILKSLLIKLMSGRD